MEIPGSILAHKQAYLLVHEISAGITALNSTTFNSLYTSIFLYFTKLLIFSILYSAVQNWEGKYYCLKFTFHLHLFKQIAHGTCKFFIWEQAIEIITNLTSLLFHMLAYIHYSNNNSYQMWSVIFSSNFIIKFTQVYHFYQYIRNGSQGQWNSHHLSIFAHTYIYVHMARHAHTDLNTTIHAHRNFEKQSALCKPLCPLTGYTCKFLKVPQHYSHTYTVYACNAQMHMIDNRDASQHSLSYN